MSYRVNSWEFEQVTRLDANGRYQYFLGKVADWQEIWTVGDDDGYQLLADGQNELVPVWPAEAYAAASCKTGQSPKKIDLTDWIDKWVPGMKNGGRKVA